MGKITIYVRYMWIRGLHIVCDISEIMNENDTTGDINCVGTNTGDRPPP